jgi:hypothetical protein
VKQVSGHVMQVLGHVSAQVPSQLLPGQVHRVWHVHCSPNTVPPGSSARVVAKLSIRRSSTCSLSFFVVVLVT